MPRSCSALLPPIALLLVVSCGYSGGQSSGDVGTRDMLTAKDLADVGDPNLLLALERLKPRWVRPRGAVSVDGVNPVVVYVNGLRVGGIEFLADIAIAEVETVGFVDATDATTRYGLDVVGGVIEVTTGSGRP